MTDKLIIIGGGPAGLSAAINAASEGLDVSILDRAPALGGQFKESNDIENYPGVPVVTGEKLSAAMIMQAAQFGVDFCCPVSAAKIERRPDGKLVVTSDDYEEREADAVVLALGLQWRRLEAPGVGELMGRGVTYGAPAVYPTGKAINVAIVGAGNSAGQQAVKMANLNPENKVYMIIRKTLAAQMSKYLIDQISKLSNIEVIEGSEVTAAYKAGDDGRLNQIMITGGRSIRVSELMIFIGGSPYTFWLKDQVQLDQHKFVLTDGNYQTSLKGVFAIGDARSGSCKRIGAAVGEGSAAIPNIHQYLASKEIK